MTRLRRPRAFSLIEIVISMAIISMILLSALATVGASQAMQFKGAQHSEAMLLAEDLMSEVLRMPYADPEQIPLWGLESGEDTGNRSQFDDTDDYEAWSATPPQYKSGEQIAWANEYSRQVDVWWVDPDDLDGTSNTETGLKRARVTVKYGTKTVLTLIGAKSSVDVEPDGGA